MTAPFGLDSDWQYLDGYEPVTLWRKQSAGGYDSGTLVSHAVAVTTAATATGEPILGEGRLSWLLCPAECSPLGEPPPKFEDVIQASPTSEYPGRWTIQSLRVYPLRSTYRAETLHEVPLA